MKASLIWAIPCALGLLLLGCKNDQLPTCDTDADCDADCPDGTNPVCVRLFPTEESGTCDCQTIGSARLSFDFESVASVEGLGTSVEGSVDMNDDENFEIRFQYAVGAPFLVSGVTDTSTGNPLTEVDVGEGFMLGYELDLGTDRIRVDFDCLDDGAAAGTAGLYLDGALVGEAQRFEATCFPTIDPFGDAFLAFAQEITRGANEWVMNPEPGVSARLVFSSLEFDSATAQLTDECMGSFGISAFTSREFASGYLMNPLGLEWGYNSTQSVYEVVNGPTGSTIFNGTAPYGELMNLDTRTVELSLEDPVPASPPLPADPNGLQTAVSFPAEAQFFRVSVGGGPTGNEWALDCITPLTGTPDLAEIVAATAEQARAIDAFFRNVPEDNRQPNQVSLYVGTWSAGPDLTFSGANGVIGAASDYGIDDASTMFAPRYSVSF
ncbi:MAG: hypothetical protein AAGF92_01435 [Myxococcota bacterium]